MFLICLLRLLRRSRRCHMCKCKIRECAEFGRSHRSDRNCIICIAPCYMFISKICTFYSFLHFCTDCGADRDVAICAKCKIREYAEFGRSRRSDRNSIICIAPCYTFRNKQKKYIWQCLSCLHRLCRRSRLCNMCKMQNQRISEFGRSRRSDIII